MTSIEVPSRVVFLNVKDGNAFFDCSPAEARMAVKLIKEMRDVGESNLDFIVRFLTTEGYKALEKRDLREYYKEMRDVGESNLDFIVRFQTEIEEVVNKAVDSVENNHWIVGGISASLMTEGYKALEKRGLSVSHIVMNAFEYSSVRLFDRDCIDTVTEAWKLRAGVVAIMWGAQIVVSKKMPKGTMVFCAMEVPEFFRVSLEYYPDCKRGLPPKKPEGDVLVHEKLDCLLALLESHVRCGKPEI